MLSVLHTIINAFTDALQNQHNQFLSGGLVLMVLGAIVAYARRLPGRGISWLQRRFIITLDITNEDPVFFWMAGWLSQQPYTRRARNLSVTTYRDHYGNVRNSSRGVEAQSAPTSNDRIEQHLPEIILTPAPGHHIFFYKHRPLWLVRTRADAQKDPQSGGFGLFNKEGFQIRMIARSQARARALIEEARALSYIEREVRTNIYVMGYDGFRRVDSCEPRPISTVFLPEGQVDEIVGDIRKFLANKAWYTTRGIPWRRGFLFYGIPGTGKTTLIRALVGEFKMDLYLISLSSGLDDRTLQHALASIPPRSAILLEDADASFDQRKKNKDVKGSLSFSGLLNALDGAASREGWVVFMTTNHLNRLDPALIRPGRTDVHLEFTHATAYQASSMFTAFFPAAAGGSSQTFGRIASQRALTMADVQKHLIIHQDSAVDALAALDVPVVEVA